MRPKSIVFSALALIVVGSFAGVALSLWQAGSTLAGLGSSNVRPVLPVGPGPASSGILVIRAEDDAIDQDSRASVDSTVAPTSTSPETSIAVVPMFSRWYAHIDRETGGASYLLVEEIERGENFSYLESEREIGPTIAALKSAALFTGDFASAAYFGSNLDAIIELACRRDFGYFFVLAGSEKPGFYVFFTNDGDTPISELLGDLYSETAQKHFDSVGYRNNHLRRGGRWGPDCADGPF